MDDDGQSYASRIIGPQRIQRVLNITYVDRGILNLIDSTTFTGAGFVIQDDGGCRLNPELARRVAQLAVGATT